MTTINERVKLVRKSEKLNKDGKMTMEKFGGKLGVGRTAIANIENGNRGVTEQMFKSICREFGVNPKWLRDGTGEMFNTDSREEEIRSFIDDILTNEPDSIKTRLVAALARLDARDWEKINEVAQSLLDEQAAEDEAAERARLHAELDRQLDEEKEAAERSSASGE